MVRERDANQIRITWLVHKKKKKSSLCVQIGNSDSRDVTHVIMMTTVPKNDLHFRPISVRWMVGERKEQRQFFENASLNFWRLNKGEVEILINL